MAHSGKAQGENRHDRRVYNEARRRLLTRHDRPRRRRQSRYRPDATPENAPTLDRLTNYAVEYFRDFVKPHKKYRAPTDIERAALEDLATSLSALPPGAAAEDVQTAVYAVGTSHEFDDLKSWFKALYETLLGQSTGPRMGSFIILYGIEETKILIDRVLKGEDLGAA